MELSPLKARIKGRLAKREIDVLAGEVLSGSIRLGDLRPLLFENPRDQLFNLYWLLATVAGRRPEALKELVGDLFKAMCLHAANESVVRSSLSVFKVMDIPGEVEDGLYDFCFRVIQAPGSSIAHRSSALLICARLCRKYPDLAGELLPAVKLIGETYGADSPGVRAAVRQVYKLLTPRSNKSYP